MTDPKKLNVPWRFISAALGTLSVGLITLQLTVFASLATKSELLGMKKDVIGMVERHHPEGAQKDREQMLQRMARLEAQMASLERQMASLARILEQRR